MLCAFSTGTTISVVAVLGYRWGWTYSAVPSGTPVMSYFQLDTLEIRVMPLLAHNFPPIGCPDLYPNFPRFDTAVDRGVWRYGCHYEGTWCSGMTCGGVPLLTKTSQPPVDEALRSRLLAPLRRKRGAAVRQCVKTATAASIRKFGNRCGYLILRRDCHQ
jgi:hypothetical protein